MVKAPLNRAARAQADWIIKDSGGKAHVLHITIDGLLPVDGIIEAAEDQYAEFCPECTFTVKKITFDQLGSGFGSVVSAAMLEDPSINYVNPMADALVPGVLPTIQSLGRNDSVKVVSFNGTPAILKYIADPTSPVVANVGESTDWLGFAAMDQAFRGLLLRRQPAEGRRGPRDQAHRRRGSHGRDPLARGAPIHLLLLRLRPEGNPQ